MCCAWWVLSMEGTAQWGVAYGGIFFPQRRYITQYKQLNPNVAAHAVIKQC